MQPSESRDPTLDQPPHCNTLLTARSTTDELVPVDQDTPPITALMRYLWQRRELAHNAGYGRRVRIASEVFLGLHPRPEDRLRVGAEDRVVAVRDDAFMSSPQKSPHEMPEV